MVGQCEYERDRALTAESIVNKLQARIDAAEKATADAKKEASKKEDDLWYQHEEDNRRVNNAEGNRRAESQGLADQIKGLRAEVNKLRQEKEELLGRLNTAPPTTKPAYLLAGGQAFGNGVLVGSNFAKLTPETLRTSSNQGGIGIALITCKRPLNLQRAMTSLLQHRGTTPAEMNKFPIVISQDGYEAQLTDLIQEKYVRTGLAYHLHHQYDENAMQIATRHGGKSSLIHVRIAQHLGFVMENMFDVFKFKQAIFLEEDLEVAPDFFSYFGSMLPTLQNDPKVYCVSAWNDNGYKELTSDERAVYLTDFFPNLGYMIEGKLWHEVKDNWVTVYWDEFMRSEDVRKNRHCIRPEISRALMFEEKGTFSNKFFKEHLSRIALNSKPVDWASEDLSYLASTDTFEAKLTKWLREATLVTLDDVSRHSNDKLRILYDDKKDFKRIATKFGLMHDKKDGVRRTAYRGVIPFSWQSNRIYLYTNSWPGSDL